MKKKQVLHPMNDHNARILGQSLSNVWNSIAPDLEAGEGKALRRWSSKRIVEACLDYLDTEHLSSDGGLGAIAWVCLSDEHGADKVVRWIAKEYPLCY